MALNVEVPLHLLKQLTQAMIVRLLKTHFFTLQSLVVRSQQNEIELVAADLLHYSNPVQKEMGKKFGEMTKLLGHQLRRVAFN